METRGREGGKGKGRRQGKEMETRGKEVDKGKGKKQGEGKRQR